MAVRLLLAHHLQVNGDVLERLKSGSGSQIAEALHELLTDRLDDLAGGLFAIFQGVMVEWLTAHQSTKAAELVDKLKAATNFGHLQQALTSKVGVNGASDIELAKHVQRLRKTFHLTTELLSRYREF